METETLIKLYGIDHNTVDLWIFELVTCKNLAMPLATFVILNLVIYVYIHNYFSSYIYYKVGTLCFPWHTHHNKNKIKGKKKAQIPYLANARTQNQKKLNRISRLIDSSYS